MWLVLLVQGTRCCYDLGASATSVLSWSRHQPYIGDGWLNSRWLHTNRVDQVHNTQSTVCNGVIMWEIVGVSVVTYLICEGVYALAKAYNVYKYTVKKIQ